MDIEVGKEHMREAFKSGSLRDLEGSSDVVGLVSGGLVGGKETWRTDSFQACYGSVHGLCGNFDPHKTEVLLDRILGGGRVSIVKQQTPEESIRYLDYFMKHPLFSQSFLEHDATKAFKERIMVRDLDSLPSNICVLALIATRAMWECGRTQIPRRFCNLVDAGVGPDWAMLMSNYFSKSGDNFERDMLYGSGHNAFDPLGMTREYAKNWLAYTPKHVVNGTLSEGRTYMTGGASVFGSFGDMGGIYKLKDLINTKGTLQSANEISQIVEEL